MASITTMPKLPDVLEVQFPAPLAYSEDWSMLTTTHAEQASQGYERRDGWTPGRARRSWAATAFGVSTRDTKTIWDFFHQQRGRAIGFIARDPLDFVLKYVRFNTDRLTIRHSGWGLRCGAQETSTLAYDADMGMVEYWPGGLLPAMETPEGLIMSVDEYRSSFPPVAPSPRTNGYPDFPAQYAFNAEMWCAFQTMIVTNSVGQEWRVNECGPFPRYGATIQIRVAKSADAQPALDFFFDRQGRWKAFWFKLPGIYEGPMRFAQDQIQIPRSDIDTVGIRMEMVSLPEQGEFVA